MEQVQKVGPNYAAKHNRWQRLGQTLYKKLLYIFYKIDSFSNKTINDNLFIMAQTIPIVPFGKYNGQPITTLLNDTKYLEWCKNQQWFQKFSVVYNICVNQTLTSTNEGSKTPAHNKLQNLFLDKERQLKLLYHLMPSIKKTYDLLDKSYELPEFKEHYKGSFVSSDIKIKIEFEYNFNWDLALFASNCTSIYPIYCNPDDGISEEESKELYKKINMKKIRDEFNKIPFVSVDKYFCSIEFNMKRRIMCEIKPLVGDDYPNILRKMKCQIELTENDMAKKSGLIRSIMEERCCSYALMVKTFESSSTTKAQLIEIFNQAGIKVIFIGDLFDDIPLLTIAESPVLQLPKTAQPQSIEEGPLEAEIKTLKEKLLQAEEKIKQLEEENTVLKTQKQSKSIKDYFGKK